MEKEFSNYQGSSLFLTFNCICDKVYLIETDNIQNIQRSCVFPLLFIIDNGITLNKVTEL